MDRYAKKAVIKEFLDWLPADMSIYTSFGDGGGCNEDPGEVLQRYIDETFITCDTAVAHGPGHQSISPCENTQLDHTHHYNDVGSWDDEDLTTQTYTKYRYSDPSNTPPDTYVLMKNKIKTPIVTYRLVFGPY